MKRILIFVSFLIVAGFLFAGCGSAKKSAVHDASPLADDFKDAPAWVIDGGSRIEDGLAAVGSAKIGKAGLNFARTEAMALARNELARIIQVQVNDLVKNFTQQTGVGDDQTVDKLSAQISKQVTKQSLSGSRQKASWISPSSTFYVLVTVDSENVKTYVKESVKTSMANEKAMWQQFQAQKGFEELDAEIAREFGE